MDAGRRHVKRRLAEARALLGGCCSVCGSTDNLHFHRRDPKTKLGAVSQLAYRAKGIFLAEVAKCGLLCQSCHVEVHRVLGPVRHHRAPGRVSIIIRRVRKRRHGAIGTYERGRRCDECQAAGESGKSLARRCNVTPRAIRQIVQRQSWAHVR